MAVVNDQLDRLGYHCEMLAHARCVARGCSCECHTRSAAIGPRSTPRVRPVIIDREPVAPKPDGRANNGHHSGRKTLPPEERAEQQAALWAKRHAEDGGYSAEEIQIATGLTYRQLDYWARTEFLIPSLSEANGSGTQRRYSKADRRTASVAKLLLDAGLSLQKLRGLGDSLTAVPAETEGIVAIGSTLHVITSAEQLLGLIRTGEVLHVVRIGA